LLHPFFTIQNNQLSMEIRISNLSSATTEQDVRRHFAAFRIMLTSQIRTISEGAKAKMGTYCFISIDNQAEARAAIEQLNGTSLLDSPILLQEGK
jgi:RNA recognition motif-containing protein